jgi:gliding motility-associated-like protein
MPYPSSKFTLPCLVVLTAIFFSPLMVLAQKEANVWHFGINAGINFNYNPPRAIYGGKTNSYWGQASIADAAGNLLFYYDGGWSYPGSRLYDRRHLSMPNNGFGNAATIENSLIVPWPGQNKKYFLFTDYPGGEGYSVIDMNLNNGFGDVTSVKNSFLKPDLNADVIALQHRNNRDFWVIFQENQTNQFSAYLVSPAGLNLTPVVSVVSGLPAVTNYGTIIKASPDGKTLAFTETDVIATKSIRLLNLDNSTGQVTLKGILSDTAAVGLEFSPDGSKLYCTRTLRNTITGNYSYRLVQYDLTAGSPANIFSSAISIFNSPPCGNINLMQAGPDGKIYLTDQINHRYINVINRPNLKGSACRFTFQSFDLDPLNTGLINSGIVLPSFIQSYFYRPKIDLQQTCFGDTARFTLSNNAYVDSVRWNFGDPGSGALNKSTVFNPRHFYATSGPKQVRAIVHFNFTSDTLTQTIYIPASITKPNLGPDRGICQGDTVKLHALQPGATYEWQDSLTTDSVFTVTQPGTYWVQVSNGCGIQSDSVTFTLNQPVSLNLGPNALLCQGQQINLQVNPNGAAILWSDSTTNNTLIVKKPGIYWAQLHNACGTWRDSITVNYRPVPAAKWLPADVTFCNKAQFTINGSRPDAISYNWQNGSTSSTFTATVSGTYWLEVTTACAIVRDSIHVTLIPNPPINLGRDTVLCAGEKLVLKVHSRGRTIRWQDNSTDSTFTVTQPGIYWAEISNVCGTLKDSVTIKTTRCFTAAFIPNIVTPNQDNLNDLFEPKGLETGTYELSIYNRWGTLIFQQKNYTNQWPDKRLSDGTYYYLLHNQQTGKTYKGWVEVIK